MRMPDVGNLVVRAEERRRMRVSPGEGRRFADGEAVDLVATAMDTHEQESARAVAQGGFLEGEFFFGKEQEYLISLGDKIIAKAYSLAGDLFARAPYKGDFHIHSNRSDGMEPPARVAVSARDVGMDFLAITDHRQYQPSLEAIKAFAGYGNGDGMLLLPGEEIHPPGNPVHMINFGGRFSVNALFDDMYADDAYEKDIEKLVAANGLAGDDAFHHAGCTWCFDKIAEAGGISILCHPHWITSNRYNINAGLLDRLFSDRRFAAFELLGGHACESNTLQVAYWQQKRAEGVRTPVVGVSDAHQTRRGGEYFGWTYTIVFSRTLTLDGLRESVQRGYSVAVESLPGEHARVHGDYRLVKYALFLLREYFPEHDRLCAVDSLDMKHHLATRKEKTCAC